MDLADKATPVSDRDQIRAIEWDCSQTVIRMGYLLDTGDFDGFARYFTEDGYWLKRGEPLQGREAIARNCASRSPTLKIRHVFTNFIVDVVDDRHATCVCYMSGRRADPGEASDGALPAHDIALWVYHDEMVREGDVWLVAKRIQERVFENDLV
ncbi:MAG: nuclear transport factor 2 family protein [Pseudomonadota bacterium]